jgi:hypothetical protein
MATKCEVPTCSADAGRLWGVLAVRLCDEHYRRASAAHRREREATTAGTPFSIPFPADVIRWAESNQPMIVNLYRAAGEWCYALFDGAAYDHSDTLGIEDDASEEEARAEIAEMFPDAAVRIVADVDEYGREV